MREYPLLYTFNKGLRNYRYSPLGKPGLSDCFNLVPRYEKLVGHVPVVDPFDGAVSIDWPFPQLFHLERGIFLAERDAIYTVDTTDWTLTKVADTSEGGLWSVVDAYDYIIISNGTQVFTGTCPCSDLTEDTDIPKGASICFHKGQVYVGAPDDYGDFFVAISKIGDITFTHDKMNTASARPVSVRGEIYSLKSLGDHVVVYGSNGISSLTPTSGPSPAAASYLQRSITSYGIISQGAVGGDSNIQVFVDSSHTLRMITSDLKITELGYQEYLEGLTSADIIVSYDPGSGDFYISDGTTGFILSQFGLSKISQLVTTCISVDGVALGTFSETASDNPYLVTDWLDMNSRGRKNINAVEVGLTAMSGIQGRVSFYVTNDYRHSGYLSPQFILNTRGCAMAKTSGNVFKARLDFDKYEELELSYMIVRWGLSEKTFIRGKYANEADVR